MIFSIGWLHKCHQKELTEVRKEEIEELTTQLETKKVSKLVIMANWAQVGSTLIEQEEADLRVLQISIFK